MPPDHGRETAAPDDTSPAARLLAEPVKVINVGLSGFAEALRSAGTGVVHVEWSPPAGGDPVLARLLGKLGS